MKISKPKLQAGDEILITAGKDKGRKGKIEKVFPKKGTARVANLNVYKKHRKGFGGEQGGIIEFSRPLPFANIALVCPSCGKQTRVGYHVDKRGEKSRVCNKCKKVISFKTDKK